MRQLGTLEHENFMKMGGSLPVASMKDYSFRTKKSCHFYWAGDVEEVTCLISTIGDVNPFLEVWGWGLLTPAGFSCCHSQHQVLKSLLELKDAHCNGEGFMLLAASASSNQQNDVKCAELLKNTNNENLNNIHQQGMTPLMLAAKGRD